MAPTVIAIEPIRLFRRGLNFVFLLHGLLGGLDIFVVHISFPALIKRQITWHLLSVWAFANCGLDSFLTPPISRWYGAYVVSFLLFLIHRLKVIVVSSHRYMDVRLLQILLLCFDLFLFICQSFHVHIRTSKYGALVMIALSSWDVAIILGSVMLQLKSSFSLCNRQGLFNIEVGWIFISRLLRWSNFCRAHIMIFACSLEVLHLLFVALHAHCEMSVSDIVGCNYSLRLWKIIANPLLLLGLLHFLLFNK